MSLPLRSKIPICALVIFDRAGYFFLEVMVFESETRIMYECFFFNHLTRLTDMPDNVN